MVDLDNLEELIDEMKQGNAKYLLVNVVGRRVRAYGRGERPQVEGFDVTSDPAALAVEELYNGKLKLMKMDRSESEFEEAAELRGEEEE